MKLLRKATFAIALATIFSLTFQCSSPKAAVTTTFEKPTTFQIKSISFQEWYAGITVGGTGVNVYVRTYNRNPSIVLDTVYFRNLKGKLVKQDGRYLAVLKNDSPLYTFQVAERPEDFPFTLTDNECAVSYVENGQTKYLKVTQPNEYAGIYYEKGVPSIYSNKISTVVASTDDEEIDD